MLGSQSNAPDVVMVLENCGYPLDARVRMEAQTLIDDGLSVEVLAPREPGRPAREVVDGVRVRRFFCPDGGGALAGTALEYAVALTLVSAAVIARLLRWRGRTLHVHNPPDCFFGLLWLARMAGWSTVFDHHDDAAGMMRAKLGPQTRLAAPLAWMRDRSAHAADLTIATNETQRDLLAPVAREAIVVRNSPPTWFADHEPAPPSGRSRLVFLGEIGAQDRVELAADVLAELVGRRGIDVELLIVGDGPRRRAVQERADRLGVGERVTFTGWVPFERVPVLLGSAHVGLDTAPPTEVNDGSTMVKIMEYLAVGLPVVATALHETRVTAADALIPVEVDSADAFADPIAELLSSPERWQEQADRAKARGRQLLWPPQAERLTEAYRQMRTRREASGHERAGTAGSVGSKPSGARPPTVDVIVPCFNYGHFLEDCVASVLAQEGVETRVLVIDDRSTDASAETARAVAATDERVELRVHSTNAGFVATANEGLTWAQGDYVLILSADDLLLPGALRRAASVMVEHPEVGMVYGRALYAEEGRPLPTPSRSRPGPSLLPAARVWGGVDWVRGRCRAGHNCVSAPTAVVRRSVQNFVGGYDPGCRHAHDLNMWLRIAAVSDIAHVREPQAIYRVHATSMSHSLDGPLVDIRERRLAFESFFATGAAELAEREELRLLAARELARQALWRASRTIDRGQEGPLTEELIEFALETYPDSHDLREWRGLALRRRIGSGRSLLFAPFLVTGAAHNLRNRIGRAMLELRGV